MKSPLLSFFVPILLAALSAPCFALDNGVQAPAASGPTIKYTPQTTVKSLANRPDTDVVEFANGRRISVGSLRRLEASAARLRAPRVDKTPRELRFQPAAKGAPVKNMKDLAAALKRPDSDTIQMPSGRLATVGQIRFIQPIVERKLGYKLTTLLPQPAPAGPATRVDASTTVAQWKEILQKPDGTVVESPNGKRITVGELKQAVKNQLKERQPVRQKGAVLSPANPGEGRPR